MFTVRSILRVVALPVILSLPVLGCTGGGEAGDDSGPPSGSVAISDFELRTDLGEAYEPPQPGQIDPEFCPHPKPDDIGCTTIGKPCVRFRCQDGEWVREEITYPAFIGAGQGSVNTAETILCPRNPETLACPSECDLCF